VYIYGPPGIGKTYLIEKYLNEYDIFYKTIPGTVSMYAFAIELAIIAYLRPNEKTVIVIDDCDKLLSNAENVNVMKKLFEGKPFEYAKRIRPADVDEEGTTSFEAVQSALNTEGVGFKINTENFHFIVTSNIRLPEENDVRKILIKNDGIPNKKYEMASHLNAIRSRCATKDLDMTSEEKWGNVAHVLLFDEGCPSISEEQKVWLLKYMHSNFSDLKETSIRTAEKMADLMLSDPENYEDEWYNDFISKKGLY
jgi:SpoVK/Ycf46/Vps4 family AAA+-type ATPase